MLSLSLSLLGLSALASAADGVITLPLNSITGRTGAFLKGLPAADRARAALLTSRAKGETTTIPATNLDYVQYTAYIGVGSPPTYYNIVVDTGSSNTFVGTGTPYVKTSTSVPTGETVNVTYGTGFFSGLEYIDQVTIAPGFVIHNQSIGDALAWADFPGVDGIIGVGPQDLTIDTLSPSVNATIPTVMDNALAQGLIAEEVLGVQFAPASTNDSTNGMLTFGGIDASLYTGTLTYTPLTTTYPANYYWGVNVSRSTYGSDLEVIPESTAGIVDTGTTQILLADDFFATYISGIPGAYVDNSTGLLVIPSSSISSLQPLSFTMYGSSATYTLDAVAQLVPQYQNYWWGGEEGVQYGYVGPLGTPSGEGLDFIIGQKFMERFYAVFDTPNQRVGFAYTDHTYSG